MRAFLSQKLQFKIILTCNVDTDIYVIETLALYHGMRNNVLTRVFVVLYGCETWSVTSREEHRLRVFENRMLRRIFGLKSDEVTRG
jgi:hypothetical protein